MSYVFEVLSFDEREFIGIFGVGIYDIGEKKMMVIMMSLVLDLLNLSYEDR